jgi:hypothetical protein
MTIVRESQILQRQTYDRPNWGDQFPKSRTIFEKSWATFVKSRTTFAKSRATYLIYYPTLSTKSV